MKHRHTGHFLKPLPCSEVCWPPSPPLWPLTLILALLEEDGLPISTASWSEGSSLTTCFDARNSTFQQVPPNIPSPASPPDLRWNLSPQDYHASLRTHAAWHWARHSQTGDAPPGSWLQPAQGGEQVLWARCLGRPGLPMPICHWFIPCSQGLPRVSEPGEGLSGGCRVQKTHTHTASPQAPEDRCSATVQTRRGSSGSRGEAGGQPPC